MTAKQEKVVSYFYDEEIGNFCYGGGNPMRPHRARMVYSLLKSYGLAKNMSVHRPGPRSFEQLTEFHADDYIDFLRSVTPLSAEDHMSQLKRFNMGQIGDVDCPVFDGVFEYCQIYAGGSVDGAATLCQGKADLAFNWSGGMHHAKKAEASGFCYVNDIVLGILELLKEFARVLYVDIDIHHGDGVEEAFYLTDRVMTVSFHKYGEFFPGTGALADIGYGKGKYYTVNVPLKDGMDDDNYRMMFEPIMSKVMEMYQPGAVVMCCGADSLSGDKLGCFNLSMEGHSHCIEFLAKYNVPMLVLGGGGYTLRNVARCWCYETGRLLGVDLPDQLPDEALHAYNYYLDTGSLRISVSNMKNMNTMEELLEIKRRVLEHLASLPPVPSAQMAYQPPVSKGPELPEEDPDVRGGGQAHEEFRRVRPGDDSDNEDDLPHTAQHDQPGISPTPGAAKSPSQSLPPSDLPAQMQAATLATSEALGGPGSRGPAGNGLGSPAPMDTDQPAGEAGASESPAQGAAEAHEAATKPIVVYGGTAAGDVAAEQLLTGQPPAGAPPISMLGPSSGVTSLVGGSAQGQAASKPASMVGASWQPPTSGAPPTNVTNGANTSDGGIYRAPQ